MAFFNVKEIMVVSYFLDVKEIMVVSYFLGWLITMVRVE